MAKSKKYQESEEQVSAIFGEMTLEEARAYRASLHKPSPTALSEEDRREAFRIYWASEKFKYGMPKELEGSIWLHLKSAKMDSPEQFEAGLVHFGFKKIKK